ncbi:MAG TPA: hypothetical protein VIB79_05415 [Candidatus Binatia bacterium]|jgi:hypothetical protein
MAVKIELTEESRECLMRHFKEGTKLHLDLKNARRNEIAGVAVYAFDCDPNEARELLRMAKDHCLPAAADIEHAIDAATAALQR